MDILGIGFPELVFIFIIALMVLGPRRLPQVAAKAGKTIRDLRNMSQGFITEWQREIAVATRIDELEETRRELQEARKLLQETQRSVTTETRQVATEASQAVSTASQVNSGTSKKTGGDQVNNKPDHGHDPAGTDLVEGDRAQSDPTPAETERTIKPPQSQASSNRAAPTTTPQEVVNE